METENNITGHYTQLVWATSEYIGCGHASFLEDISVHDNPKSPHVVHRLVCNYGPAGNIQGASVYRIGKPCSACSNKICDKTYTGLCKGTAFLLIKALHKRGIFHC